MAPPASCVAQQVVPVNEYPPTALFFTAWRR